MLPVGPPLHLGNAGLLLLLYFTFQSSNKRLLYVGWSQTQFKLHPANLQTLPTACLLQTTCLLDHRDRRSLFVVFLSRSSIFLMPMSLSRELSIYV